MSFFIDIHRHSSDRGKADIVLRNLFHNQISETENQKYFSIGLHPWHLRPGEYISDLVQIETVLQNRRLLAIGETGIDKTVNIDLNIQSQVFERHLEWSVKMKKPLIIHCVRAYNELLEYRKWTDQSIPWIFHWFNASTELALDLVKKGCYLSFGHMLFKETSKAYKSFREIPKDRIFFETDDAGCTIVDVYEQATNLLHCSMYDLQNQILSNFNTCFNI